MPNTVLYDIQMYLVINIKNIVIQSNILQVQCIYKWGNICMKM